MRKTGGEKFTSKAVVARSILKINYGSKLNHNEADWLRGMMFMAHPKTPRKIT
jgi:hypothetical protein